ncbi:aminodeoxychorismate synthase component I [Ornithinibacillus salinisoli]|uniref:Aminodeoxychorismate synthase component I n=1 Tax=Ornithinibacillus salinisoli TaxID=1848459 RepID=A0ABW4W3Z6_9BACI
MNHELYFDFIHDNGKKEPLCFKDPVDVIVAHSVEEILPCLNKIQDAIHNGYYAAGYLSYEAAPAFDSAFAVHENSTMPLLWFGIFHKPTSEPLLSSNHFHTDTWEPQTDINKYNQSIAKIKDYIAQGDTYQVNYTIRLSSDFQGDAIAYYNQLAASQSANYSAYLDIGSHQILSASPELFFHLKDGKITTKPMKGTIGRGETLKEDAANAEWLYHSEKNRAENVMIVDLLRNDLGRIAKAGTVRVPQLFTIEEYPTVYQMTSTVTAEVEPETTVTDIFKALFPCGSITGAPKVSTMKIIHELETSPREVYCGTIGFITPEKEAIFNVPIRTVLIDNTFGHAQYGVGGGITWDSTSKEEYDEVLTKAKILTNSPADFQLLETFGLRDGAYIVWEEHLERLKRSADFFQFHIDTEKVGAQLMQIAEGKSSGYWKVRLLVSSNGETKIEVQESPPITESVRVSLSKEPVQKNDVFLYHKTTNRSVYERMKEQSPHVFDVLLWNEEKEVTEFTIGNVVVEMEGKLYTPPVASGLLAGTFRSSLLKDGIIEERRITVDQLNACTNIWLINSVRKWVHVEMITS